MSYLPYILVVGGLWLLGEYCYALIKRIKNPPQANFAFDDDEDSQYNEYWWNDGKPLNFGEWKDE